MGRDVCKLSVSERQMYVKHAHALDFPVCVCYNIKVAI